MRLDKLVAKCGFGTRTEVKKFLKKGLITVNGTHPKSASIHVDEVNDEIFVNGVLLEYREFVYLMMNKPQDYISATEDRTQATVIDLIDPSYYHFDLFPMGRLDKDTEGLLILTNDGKLAHKVLSPKNHVEKTYYVEVDGLITEDDIFKFNKGLYLGDFTTMPAKLEILEASEESKAIVIIKEGKYHQVKRMFEEVGKTVSYLKRIKMGGLELDEDLELGEYKELSEEDLDLIISK